MRNSRVLSPKGHDIRQGGDLLGMAHILDEGQMLERSGVKRNERTECSGSICPFGGVSR